MLTFRTRNKVKGSAKKVEIASFTWWTRKVLFFVLLDREGKILAAICHSTSAYTDILAEIREEFFREFFVSLSLINSNELVSRVLIWLTSEKNLLSFLNEANLGWNLIARCYFQLFFHSKYQQCYAQSIHFCSCESTSWNWDSKNFLMALVGVKSLLIIILPFEFSRLLIKIVGLF